MSTVTRRDAGGDFEGMMTGWAGSFTIFSLGMVHLLQAEEFFAAAAYVGLLALAGFAVACVAAVALARGGGPLAWLVGAGFSGVSLGLFLVSRTLGLPGYEETVGQWLNFPAWCGVGLGLAYLALCALGLRRGPGGG